MRTVSGPGTMPSATGGDPAQRDVVLSFVGKQTQVRKTGMIFPETLSERSWERIGSSLRELSNSSAWWLGDWLVFGEAAYGWRRYREAIERTGLDYQTLRNYAWVARRFEHDRRRDTLSFAHHAEVTRLSPPEQDYWLRRAEQRKWSRNELRRAVRAGLAEQSGPAGTLPAPGDRQPGTTPPPAGATAAAGAGAAATATVAAGAGAGAGERPPAGTTLTIELSAGQLDHYAEAAAAHGLPVGQWVTRVLDAAGRRPV